jgi:hypothetical protein
VTAQPLPYATVGMVWPALASSVVEMFCAGTENRL